MPPLVARSLPPLHLLEPTELPLTLDHAAYSVGRHRVRYAASGISHQLRNGLSPRRVPRARRPACSQRHQLLRRPEQAAIAHRLAHYAELRLLSRDETCAYLEHRCTLAGARTNPFDGDAQQSIFEMSRGNLRAIDRLALAALQRVAKSSHSTVSAGDVIAARKSLWP